MGITYWSINGMSNTHKGSWNRVRDRKAWDECPLWDNIEKKKEAAKKAESKPKPKKRNK